MTTRSGMTLIEVVVAMTITGVALAAGYGTLATLVDRGDRADEVAEAAVHDAVLRQTLVEWLAAARVGVEAGPAFEGLDGEYEGSPDDVLVFRTAARTPIQARETIIMIYIDRDEATPERGLVAVLAPWHGSAGPETPSLSVTQRQSGGAGGTAAARRIELLPQATSLDIFYRSGLLGDARWLPSWISSTVPPSGIEMRIGANDPDAIPPLLRLPLRVPVRSIR